MPRLKKHLLPKTPKSTEAPPLADTTPPSPPPAVTSSRTNSSPEKPKDRAPGWISRTLDRLEKLVFGGSDQADPEAKAGFRWKK